LNTNQENDYVQSINRVMNYIEENLGKELTLPDLAAVSGFSQYHFHRIFTAMTGETLFAFIQRLRLEKAATLLCDARANHSITLLAVDLGFSSPSVFSRTFKARFGCSPSQWQNRCRKQNQIESKLSQLLRKTGHAEKDNLRYAVATPLGEKQTQRRKSMQTEVSIQEIPQTTVAYIRYIGPYAGDKELFEGLYSKISSWAQARDIQFESSYVIYHDDPSITEETKLRISVCIPIAADVQVSGEFGKMHIGGGKYAVGRFSLSPDQFGEAWSYMCGQYLPTSGWRPADSVPFERYSSCSEETPGKLLVDICIPVEPA